MTEVAQVQKGSFRRLAVVGMAVILPLGVLGPGARADSPRQSERKQVVHGRILVASGTYHVGQIIVHACGFLGASAHWVAGDGANGVVAFRFDVAVAGVPFVLTPAQPADLDITFHGSGPSTGFEGRGLKEERGTVPQGAKHADVCMAAGVPTDFTYEAYGHSEASQPTHNQASADEGPDVPCVDSYACAMLCTSVRVCIPQNRSIDFTLIGHLRAHGTLRSDDPRCRSAVPVIIERETADGWVPVRSTTSSVKGTFSLELADHQGRYRAVAPDVARQTRICGRVVSQPTEHRH